MSAPTANQLRKEADIKKEIRAYLKTLIYNKEWIYNQVAWKFYLDPETVARIHYGEYDRRRELELERAAMDGVQPKKRPARRRKPRFSKWHSR